MGTKIPPHWIGNSPHFQWTGDVAHFGFGKHYGKDISYVVRKDRQYLEWLSDHDGLPPHVPLVASQALKLSPFELKKWLKESFWSQGR